MIYLYPAISIYFRVARSPDSDPNLHKIEKLMTNQEAATPLTTAPDHRTAPEIARQCAPGHRRDALPRRLRPPGWVPVGHRYFWWLSSSPRCAPNPGTLAGPTGTASSSPKATAPRPFMPYSPAWVILPGRTTHPAPIRQHAPGPSRLRLHPGGGNPPPAPWARACPSPTPGPGDPSQRQRQPDLHPHG